MAEDTPKQKQKKSSDIENSTEADKKFLVVGLGASAGGIQALKKFFSQVPSETGMAYVVILHMSPSHDSKLAEILQINSVIPITQVTEKERIEPNHVYVIPPNQNLAITDGHLVLTQMIGLEERRSPVDLFFRTLGDVKASRAVAVILSGTGANGSMGLKRIKEHGGVAFVQDPTEAEYSDMPRNAIATGMVDYVLPVAAIPAKIISYREHIGHVHLADQPEEAPKSDEHALLEIFTHLRTGTGHDFSNYKRATILRRIERRIGLREVSGLAEYAHYLREQPDEVQALMKDLLISVTNFFRDAESLKTLAETVIPKILEGKEIDDAVRIWVAACATGEEAYSVAILLAEQISRKGGTPNVQIFATDLDHEAIQVAREGYYLDAEVADVSPERLRRFFNREVDGYRIRRELRESILFAVHNVIKDPAFSHLDLILCRNLLIYLNRVAQGRLLEVFHFALNPSGHLFLGSSESTVGASDLFVGVNNDHHIFRARPVPTRTFPTADITFRPLPPLIELEKFPQEKRAMERLSYTDLHQRLLEQYGPPSLIVNENYEIVHLTERAGRYMQLTGGEPSHNLLKIIRPELRLELRTALYQAVHDRTEVEAKGLKAHTESGIHTINILVRPVLREEDTARGFILVLFEEIEGGETGLPPTIVPKSPEPIARRLEEELVHSKKQLRATVEQYEIQQEELRASNEELHAMNEELRSAAEELETSKEELQSVNEELRTVNQELKIKIEELSQANNNFQNLMNSTNIGTVFLDRALRVRQFTPTAQETFNLISSDIGRPLMDLTTKLKGSYLLDDIEVVLNKLQIVKREVETTTGSHFIMRLSPYRTLDEKIDGVVITLFNVSELTIAREALQEAHEELEARVRIRTSELNTSNEMLRTEVKERAHLEDMRMQLLAQLVTSQEDERRAFARDLHDQLGQQLTLLRMRLEDLNISNVLPERVTMAIGDLLGIVRQLDSDVDFLAWQLRPIVLDDLGLAAALEHYVRHWSRHFKINGEFRSGELPHGRFTFQAETHLYRIVQEALNNCAKHSNCKSAEILLECRDDQIVLIIEDDGVGFDPDQVNDESRWGLIGMRERAALLKGTVEIESTPSTGVSIFVSVPLANVRLPQEDE